MAQVGGCILSIKLSENFEKTSDYSATKGRRNCLNVAQKTTICILSGTQQFSEKSGTKTAKTSGAA